MCSTAALPGRDVLHRARLAPCPAVLRAAGAAVVPRWQYARPSCCCLPGRSRQWVWSGCPVLLNPPKPQRKLGEGFFFLEKRRLCSALPLRRARGSSSAEQRILVLPGRPCALGCCAAAGTRSSDEVQGASTHWLGGQHRVCVQPHCSGFFSTHSGPFGCFCSLLVLLFLIKPLS